MPALAINFVAGLLGPKFGKFAAPLLYALAALMLIGGFFGLKSCYDHRVIANHDAKQEAATTKADQKADAHAADQRRADDSRLTQEKTELERSTTNAQTDHDRSLARFHCIKLQQDARAAKRQPPACAGPGVPSGTGRTH